MATFEWIENPEKDIADSTRGLYEKRLNTLARMGYTNREALLNNAVAIRNFVDSKGKQMRNLYYGAIFYILGRVEPETNPGAKVLVDGFQKNYYGEKPIPKK